MVRADSGALDVHLPDASFSAPLSGLGRAYHDAIPSIMSRSPERVIFEEAPQVAGH
jgi:hypothetical protein